MSPHTILHSILGRSKVGVGCLVGAYSSHSIHRSKEVGPQSRKGVYYGHKKVSCRHKGGQYPRCKATVLQPNWVGSWRWPCGFCALLLVGLWSSLGLVPNYVVLILGNEGGGPHHIQGHHTWDLRNNIRKLVVLTCNIHHIFNRG